MPSTYKIVASSTFELSLNRWMHFLSRKYSAKLAVEIKLSVKQSLKYKLSENPYLAPISDRLIDLGIKDYRQYALDSHNIIFYRINEVKKQVVLLIVMDSRQSIQKLLADIVLLT
ncbi:MAG: hypothetical protein Q9M92_18090 [Enterobacterales bacterium]|nr:hypothetical protein [Enterobacterales bacterium]